MPKEDAQAVAQEVGAGSGEESAGEMTWPPPNFDKIPKVKPGVHQRKKRYHSASFSHSGVNGLTIDGVPSDIYTLTAALHRVQLGGNRLPYGKNSKKSRDGRRIPSKRGGKNHENPADVLEEMELDPEDPDYDSDSNNPVMFEELNPALSDEAFERTLSTLLNEFFDHGKTQEVIDALTDVNLAAYQRRRIPYLAITLAIQRKQTQCELTSELLSDMCGKILNHAHIQQGFQLVLNELGDLIIDVPKASEYVGRFIARAIADDILPPKFVELQKSTLSQMPLVGSPLKVHGDGDSNNAESVTISPPGSTTLVQLCASNDESRARPSSRNLSDSSAGIPMTVNNTTNGTTTSSGIGSASSLTTTTNLRPDLAIQALTRAESILTLRHAFARLDNIWGVPAGPRAIKILIKKIRRLLNQFMTSNDIDEATEALLELDSPHFHHELVYQSVIMAIEISTDDARDRIIRLLDDMCHSVVLTSDQLSLGIRRVYAELPDLQLDVPAAYTLMERFVDAAHKAGFLPKTLANALPTKHRKRFVSETDSIYRSPHPIKPL